MTRYYLELAWDSLKRSPVLSSLMVLAIGLGIGASMTMITVLHVMSGDPVPGLSSKLFVPMLDPRPMQQGRAPQTGVRSTPDGFTWTDAMNLLRAVRANGQAAMDAGSVAIQPARADLYPFFERGEYVTSDFFPMFHVPFATGAAWTAEQDQERGRVVVLSASLGRKLFGSAAAIGQTVSLNNTDFRVIGVLKNWHPQPAFYVQTGGRVFGSPDQFFLPLQTAKGRKFAFNDRFSCWGSGGDNRTSDHCTWLQFWSVDSILKCNT